MNARGFFCSTVDLRDLNCCISSESYCCECKKCIYDESLIEKRYIKDIWPNVLPISSSVDNFFPLDISPSTISSSEDWDTETPAGLEGWLTGTDSAAEV